MILADQCPPDGKFYMCRMGCAGELSTTFVPTVGGIIYTVASAGLSDPYRADRRRDDSTDSPFSAVLLAVWENLYRPPWSGAGAFNT